MRPITKVRRKSDLIPVAGQEVLWGMNTTLKPIIQT
jgi:hypothetical protein